MSDTLELYYVRPSKDLRSARYFMSEDFAHNASESTREASDVALRKHKSKALDAFCESRVDMRCCVPSDDKSVAKSVETSGNSPGHLSNAPPRLSASPIISAVASTNARRILSISAILISALYLCLGLVLFVFECFFYRDRVAV